MTKTSHVHVLLLLIMTLEVSAGGFGSNWNVSYSPTHICALEGSSVQMSCSYTYPSYSKVTEASWINQNSFNTANLSKDKRYTHRVRVDCGDKRSQCSLYMTNLTKTDAQYQYYCRIITDYELQREIGTPGISLSVTSLEVVSSGKESEVKEGDHVTLTCSTTCNLTRRPSFIWSKDGRPVKKKQIIHNQLQLHPVSREDEGNYTCAVRRHEDLPSQPLRIKVICQTVITSNSAGVKEGDNVTFTCSITDCPLSGSTSFIWSKDGRPVEKKQIIYNQLQLHPVSYEDEGSYTCAVRGHEDHSSPAFIFKLISEGHSLLTAGLVGLAVVCGGVGLTCAIYWLRSWKGNGKAPNGTQSLNPSTIQPDAVYQSLNPNTTQSDAVYQSLNPNTTQPDAVYQSLKPTPSNLLQFTRA